jgi:hypothetical protein
MRWSIEMLKRDNIGYLANDSCVLHAGAKQALLRAHIGR